MADPLNGIQVLVKVEVASTPTVFPDQTTGTLNLTNTEIESVGTGETNWDRRDVIRRGANLAISTLTPAASNLAIIEVQNAALNGTKVNVSVVEPSLLTWAFTATVTVSNTFDATGKYVKTFTCNSDSTVTAT